MKCWNCGETLENVEFYQYKHKLLKSLNQLVEYHKALGSANVVEGINQAIDVVIHNQKQGDNNE